MKTFQYLDDSMSGVLIMPVSSQKESKTTVPNLIMDTQVGRSEKRCLDYRACFCYFLRHPEACDMTTTAVNV